MWRRRVSYNGAEMRVWVDPTSPCGLRRADRGGINYYKIWLGHPLRERVRGFVPIYQDLRFGDFFNYIPAFLIEI